MSSRPITIAIAAAVEALVGLAAAAGGVFALLNGLLGPDGHMASALPLAAFAAAVAAGAGYAAWGLFQLRDWARTPVLVTQLFLLVIAYYMATSAQYAISAVLVLAAAAGIASVLAPRTTATLFPEEKGQR